ncbi:hypothetical protein PCANC_21439 [Puccinia coronata f. sp. avenae]|uniref:Uncharacterized protein n=1 Tax=Puccinia coronata f. sp. avenae TaxID=200324 RepID=A0A2N5TRS7_9BASI|nr:hypothetical protein PCANC_21439 [Puccinia coronata f. sp. avenae]
MPFFNTTISFLTSSSFSWLISNKIKQFFNPTIYSFMEDVSNSDIVILILATLTLWYLSCIVKDLIAWFRFVYDGMKKKSETSQSVSPDYVEPPRLKNLGIFDSLITFSQPNINAYNPAHYKSMIEACGDPKFPSGIDSELLCAALRKTCDLTRGVNDKLEQIAITGFHTMLMFAFEGDEDNDSRTESDRIEKQLTNLLRLIQSTELLNEELSKEMQQLNTDLRHVLLVMDKIHGSAKFSGRFQVKLFFGEFDIFLDNKSAEYWRRELKLYSCNVQFTKIVNRCAGNPRRYLQHSVKQALDQLLQIKNKCIDE